MAVNSYALLRLTVALYLDRDDLENLIPEFIRNGEADINRRLRSRDQITVETGTLTASTATYALPTGFLAMENVYVEGNPPHQLEPWTPQRFYQSRYSHEAGVPKVFIILGTNIIYGPVPDSGYTYTLNYYKRWDIATTLTNSLLDKAQDLYLYAALLQSAPYLAEDDTRLPAWRMMYEQTLASVIEEETSARYHGGTLRVVTDAGVA